MTVEIEDFDRGHFYLRARSSQNTHEFVNIGTSARLGVLDATVTSQR